MNLDQPAPSPTDLTKMVFKGDVGKVKNLRIHLPIAAWQSLREDVRILGNGTQIDGAFAFDQAEESIEMATQPLRKSLLLVDSIMGASGFLALIKD